MGAWSLYFIAKLGLHWSQAITLHWWPNLLFALALAWPLPGVGGSGPRPADDAVRARRGQRLRVLRQVLALPVAVALLYHDSHLPPPARVLGTAGDVATFSPGYLWELAQRFVPLQALVAFALLVLAYVLLARRLRFASIALLGLLLVPVLPGGSWWGPRVAPLPLNAGDGVVQAAQAGPLRLEQLEGALSGFYAEQRQKAVAMPSTGTPPPFDLVFLSICSLSWDDLDLMGLRQAPLLGQLDIVFRQFNSAASYSGPAVLRLLHGTCGQGPQSALYEGAPDECTLFRSLAAAGYQPALLLNHDGRFDKFAQQLQAQGGMGVLPADVSSAPVAMSAFDGSPIRGDYDVLAQWWRTQPAAPGGARHALLYNTITLHDGNRVPGFKSQHSTETYKPRLTRLFADLERFIELVQASGRPTVIVLVPEHGGAVRGDAVQVSGLREIPTPAITHVPVGVKLVGFKGYGGGSPLVVEQPSSYLALTTLIAGLLQAGDGIDRGGVESLLRTLPATEWVAENDGTVLLRREGRSYLRPPDGQWTEFGAR
jgi:cellulose synthase operon protein YhjU